MKILVIDDKQRNRDSAIKTLNGHEVTVVSSCDEARELINGKVPWKKVYAALGRSTNVGGINMDSEYMAKENELRPVFDFEVVLLDLMMPARGGMSCTVPYPGDEEVPFGFPLMIEIAWRKSNVVKHIAIVSDVNHHKHVMSASLDALGGYDLGTNILINGVKCHFQHARMIGESGQEAKDWSASLKGMLQLPTESKVQ